jgi:hypothetical protein
MRSLALATILFAASALAWDGGAPTAAWLDWLDAGGYDAGTFWQWTDAGYPNIANFTVITSITPVVTQARPVVGTCYTYNDACLTVQVCPPSLPQIVGNACPAPTIVIPVGATCSLPDGGSC